MFIEAIDKANPDQYNNVNLDYVISYKISGELLNDGIVMIEFSILNKRDSIKMTFNNYHDAVLAIDSIRYLQQGYTFDSNGNIETIKNNCNLYNLDTIVKNLKIRRSKSKKLGYISILVTFPPTVQYSVQ